MPEHIIEIAALGNGHPFSSKPMGSGPFQYVPVARREGNDKKKSNFVFERNNKYHRWSDESNIKYVKIKKDGNYEKENLSIISWNTPAFGELAGCVKPPIHKAYVSS